MISALGLQFLVIPAVALASLAPIVLIALVIRDLRGKALW